MPRLVKKTATGPIKVGEHDICMCGLSENQPFCDKSHNLTKAESKDKLYWYVDGKAEEVATESDDACSGHCHEGGCGNCH